MPSIGRRRQHAAMANSAPFSSFSISSQPFGVSFTPTFGSSSFGFGSSAFTATTSPAASTSGLFGSASAESTPSVFGASPAVTPSTAASSAGSGMPSRSASAIIAGADSGYHLLKIDGYSRTKELPNCECIKSCPFNVGGYRWRIDYYPNGVHSECTDYISLYLYLDGTVAQAVKAWFDISLADQAGEPVSSHTKTSKIRSFSATQRSRGYKTFMTREDLDRSEHLKNNCFTLRCDITVMKEIRTEAATPFVLVPPSDLHEHFGELLLSKEGADVTIEVGSESFSAHRCVLGARSPVFKVELFGPMKESTIKIDDMEAQVFRALLHFIYTDSMRPEMTEQKAMMDLLIAADRYNIARLKLMCEDELCKHIDASTVATTLVLAEQHRCYGLKEACFEFLSSRANLEAVMATEGYEHLTRSCPSLLKELIAKVTY